MINKVVLVGQPRSGTSMMMRVLEFGGVECEYDETRPNQLRKQFRNIHGFYETKEKKPTKCFKCFTPIRLLDIPEDWRVIFIERKIEGVFESWKQVHKREVKEDMKEQIQDIRTKLHRMLDKFDFNVLKLEYDDMCKNPAENIEKIREFLLPDEFNAEEALKAIDGELYVERGIE